MGTVLQDIRFALRILRGQPWIVLAAVVTLGLGIGATAAIFTLVSALYLKPLPFEDLDRLVQVERLRTIGLDRRVSAQQFMLWRKRFWEEALWGKGDGEGRPPFEAMAAYSLEPVIVTSGLEERPLLLKGCQVTGDFFAVFGLRARLGRPFDERELAPGGPRAVLLAHRTWQRHFGGDENVVGAQMRLDGIEHQIVGVLPPSFDYPLGTDIWLPLREGPNSNDRIAVLAVSARLRPGISEAEAQEQMKPVARSVDEFRGATGTNLAETISVRSFVSYLYGDQRNTFLLLGGGVLFLLLIACANVINLQLARIGVRVPEIAIRLALGGRLREILRLLLIENLLLSALGGLLGLALCYFVAPVLGTALLRNLQLFNEVETDLWVFGLILAMVAVVGTVTGLVPAFKAMGTPVTAVLQESSSRGGLGRAQQWRRLALVSSQVALAIVLMIGATLLAKSSLTVSRIDPGLRKESVLTAELGLSDVRFRTGVALERLTRELLPDLATLPGVQTATAATNLPMQGGPPIGFRVLGRDPNDRDAEGGCQFLGVAPGYFSALGIPLRRGRVFAAGDALESEAVAVINEAMAALFWPDSDPIGEILLLGAPVFPELGDERLRRIVGVVGNVREDGFAAAAPPLLYLPLAQIPEPFIERLVTVRPLGLILHTEIGPMAAARPLRETVSRFDRDLPVDSTEPLDRLLDQRLGPDLYRATLVGLFAAASLILSIIGVYGVLTYLVTQRTREIGIRIALGAEPRRVVMLILKHGMGAVIVGVGLGVSAAAALNHVIASVVVISPLDPLAFIAAPVFFTLLALGAMLPPALRAARIEPGRALRFG